MRYWADSIEMFIANGDNPYINNLMYLLVKFSRLQQFPNQIDAKILNDDGSELKARLIITGNVADGAELLGEIIEDAHKVSEWIINGENVTVQLNGDDGDSFYVHLYASYDEYIVMRSDGKVYSVKQTVHLGQWTVYVDDEYVTFGGPLRDCLAMMFSLCITDEVS